ncbi:hypothetical protein ACIQWB_38540, partial [Streptomyces olivaceus]|uniref:hypothetical protein n=1 Tax=Streptomyces olivaceus TaxID=47716 RepID=UPI0037FA5741
MLTSDFFGLDARLMQNRKQLLFGMDQVVVTGLTDEEDRALQFFTGQQRMQIRIAGTHNGDGFAEALLQSFDRGVTGISTLAGQDGLSFPVGPAHSIKVLLATSPVSTIVTLMCRHQPRVRILTAVRGV